MRVLFTDKVRAATTSISSLYGTQGYPETNLADRFLDRLFVSAFETDTITIDFASAVSVQDIFLANCNATSFTYTLEDSSHATLATGTVTIADDVSAVHLTAAVAARYLVIEATTTETYLKLKGIGAGVAYTMPGYLLNDFPVTRTGKVTRQKSDRGQVSASTYVPLRKYEWHYREIAFDDMTAFLAAYSEAGPGVPVYWDLFEDTTAFIRPQYAEILEEPTVTPDGSTKKWKITFTTEEAR